MSVTTALSKVLICEVPSDRKSQTPVRNSLGAT